MKAHPIILEPLGGPVVAADTNPAPVPMPVPVIAKQAGRGARTQFSMKALSLADRFQQACGSLRLAGTSSSFRLVLSAPEGLSTGGGKQAVQHLKLVPENGTTIVMGQANQFEGTCELRSYEYLSSVHAQRFKGQTLPFEPSPYDAIMQTVEDFFVGEKLAVTTASHFASPATAAAPRSGGPMMSYGRIAAAVVAVAGVAAALIHLLH